MDTSEFDTKIGKMEEDMKNLREQMEKTCNDFLLATNEFVIDWFKKNVEKEVQSHPEITKKLDVEGLRKLKSDLQDLILKAPDLINRYLNVDTYWGHRGIISKDGENRSRRYFSYRELAPVEGPLDESIRIILGYVGELYAKYGYISDNSPDYINYRWQRKSGSNQRRYSISYDWSKKMSEIMKKYSEQYDRLVSLDENLKEIKQDKEKAEAKRLWDQV
jgi:hypothetical protein